MNSSQGSKVAEFQKPHTPCLYRNFILHGKYPSNQIIVYKTDTGCKTKHSNAPLQSSVNISALK